jgi:hypothetical protein
MRDFCNHGSAPWLCLFKAGEVSCMKIFNDTKTQGLVSEKNETQGRISKKTGSDKSAPVTLAADEIELTGKKAPAASAIREVEIANAASVEFDVNEVPMMKMRLAALNNYILSNPSEALSAHANINADLVAGLIG